MELKNACSNGDNVLASNLNIKIFCYLKDVKIEVEKHTLHVNLLKAWHDCPKDKIPHIVHLTNQYLNESKLPLYIWINP